MDKKEITAVQFDKLIAALGVDTLSAARIVTAFYSMNTLEMHTWSDSHELEIGNHGDAK